MLLNIDDVRDFDAMLQGRIDRYRAKLRDWLAPHRLTLREARLHKVLIPMVGVYTPGWQALPACSWEFVELVTEQGLTGTGEWSIQVNDKTRECLEQLRNNPGRNLCDPDFEEPLYMAWWDLIGQVLGSRCTCYGQSFSRSVSLPPIAFQWPLTLGSASPISKAVARSLSIPGLSLLLAGPGEDFPLSRYL